MDITTDVAQPVVSTGWMKVIIWGLDLAEINHRSLHLASFDYHCINSILHSTVTGRHGS